MTGVLFGTLDLGLMVLFGTLDLGLMALLRESFLSTVGPGDLVGLERGDCLRC